MECRFACDAGRVRERRRPEDGARRDLIGADGWMVESLVGGGERKTAVQVIAVKETGRHWPPSSARLIATLTTHRLQSASGRIVAAAPVPFNRPNCPLNCNRFGRRGECLHSC